MPLSVSILRIKWEAFLPALSKIGRYLLGVPFNIASYALLTMMIAKVTNLEPGEFVHTLGDAHIYQNHLPQVNMQLEREERTLPQLRITRDVKSIFDFTFDDFVLENYDPHPHIKGEVSV